MSPFTELARVIYEDVAARLDLRAEHLDRNAEDLLPRSEVEILRDVARLCREKTMDSSHLEELVSSFRGETSPIQI